MDTPAKGPTPAPAGRTRPGPYRTPATPQSAIVADYGGLLPIGVLEGNPPVRHKSFEFRSYDFEAELEYDKLRNKKGGSGEHPGRQVVDLLAYMLTSWGGNENFQSGSWENRRMAIERSYMVDVLYAYVYLRTEVDEMYSVKATCPSCQQEFDWHADLNGLSTGIVADGEEVPSAIWQLFKPLKYDNKPYAFLHLHPPTWSAVSGFEQRNAPTAKLKMQLMMSGIFGMSDTPDGAAMPVTRHLLRRLSKKDLERVTAFIDDAFPAVDLAFEMEHASEAVIDGEEVELDGCGHTWTHNTPWQFDFFFGASSMRPIAGA